MNKKCHWGSVVLGALIGLSVPVIWFGVTALGAGISGAPLLDVMVIPVSGVILQFILAILVIRKIDFKLALVLAGTMFLGLAVGGGFSGWSFTLACLFGLMIPAVIAAHLVLRCGLGILPLLDNSRSLFGRTPVKVGMVIIALFLWSLAFFTRSPPFTELHGITTVFPGHSLDIEAVKRSIASGVDVNAPSPYGGETALHYAAGQESVELVQLLVDAGANINARDDLGQTPLHIAARGFSLPVMSKLSSSRAPTST